MIIKFKSNASWVIFGEVDHVEYREIKEDLDKMAMSSSVLKYAPPGDAAAGTWIGLSFFTKNMTEATEIIASTPIYLMNDEGRTVETI